MNNLALDSIYNKNYNLVNANYKLVFIINSC